MAEPWTERSKDEVYGLIEQAQQGDDEAKARLTEMNAGLVRKAAWRFAGADYEMEDLVQIGYIGLLKAIDNFDVHYQVKFSTYAVPVILGELRRVFRDGGRLKAGRKIKTEIGKMRKADEELKLKLGREPKLGELAEGMETTKEHLLEILEAEQQLSKVESLDSMESDGCPQGDSAGSPESRLDAMMLREEIRSLRGKEKQVILLRYYKDMSQSATGKILGISQVQVSRIEKKVIGRIRQKMAE